MSEKSESDLEPDDESSPDDDESSPDDDESYPKEPIDFIPPPPKTTPLITLLFNSKMVLCDISLEDISQPIIPAEEEIISNHYLKLAVTIDSNNKSLISMTNTTSRNNFTYDITLNQLLHLRCNKRHFSHIIKLLIINKLITGGKSVNKIVDSVPFLKGDGKMKSSFSAQSVILLNIKKQCAAYIKKDINTYLSLIVDFNNSPLFVLKDLINNTDDVMIPKENEEGKAQFEIEFRTQFMIIIRVPNSENFLKPFTTITDENAGTILSIVTPNDYIQKYNKYHTLLNEIMNLLKTKFSNVTPQTRGELYILLGTFSLFLVYTEIIAYHLIIDKFFSSNDFDYDIDAMFFIEILSKFYKLATNCFSNFMEEYKTNVNYGNYGLNLGNELKLLFPNKSGLLALKAEYEKNLSELISKVEKYKEAYKNKITQARVGEYQPRGNP